LEEVFLFAVGIDALETEEDADLWLFFDFMVVGVHAVCVFFAFCGEVVAGVGFGKEAVLLEFFDVEVEVVAGEVGGFLEGGEVSVGGEEEGAEDGSLGGMGVWFVAHLIVS